MGYSDDIKRFWRQGDLLQHLIVINVAVFVLMKMVTVVGVLFLADWGSIFNFLYLPGSVSGVLHKPWTLLTYMFVHADLLHILFNMLWLYWLGKIFLEFFTAKQLGGLYFLGGLGGALLYVLAYSFLPYFAAAEGAVLVGASAAIIAVVVAVAIYSPEYKINLLFFGAVSLKWIAIITIFIDFLSMDGTNAGGHISHIGGALVGLWFGVAIRSGHDITRPVNSVIDWMVNQYCGLCEYVANRRKKGAKSTNTKASHPGTRAEVPTESEIDAILDKLKMSGYAALSDEEKAMLFRASGKK
ncbi:MAG: rhomboid family intramembrane serine protease [Muribaculaceae bacterium]|nr:rhomboid family intramembrane serine protease [Muribaculaceae bacterium]